MSLTKAGCDAVMMWEGGDLIHVIDKGRVCMMQ